MFNQIRSPYIKKPLQPEATTFPHEMNNFIKLISELNKLKSDLISIKKQHIDEFDAHNKIHGEKIQDIDDKLVDIQATLESVLTIEKGEKGEKPILGIDYFAPKDGKTPSKEDLLSLIKPLIPEVQHGKTPTEKELLKLIKPLIPEVRNGIDAKIDEEGISDKIIQKIIKEKKLKSDHIDGTETAMASYLRRYGYKPYVHGGGDTLVAGTNITVTNNSNGTKTISSSIGASSFNVETPVGVVNGVNVTYTVTNTISKVLGFSINGMAIHPAEYSTSATTITFVTALPVELSGTGFTIIYI